MQQETTNIYQTQGCIDDCHNDMSIIQEVMTDLNNLQSKIQKFMEQGALAYGCSSFEYLSMNATHLDSRLKDHLQKIQDGIEYHEQTEVAK